MQQSISKIKLEKSPNSFEDIAPCCINSTYITKNSYLILAHLKGLPLTLCPMSSNKPAGIKYATCFKDLNCKYGL